MSLIEYPFSVKLPPEMRQKLDREAAIRGGIPVGVLIRMIIADHFNAQKRKRKKKDKAEAEQPTAK